jgi:hypothetical protein
MMTFCNNLSCEYGDEPLERISDYRIVDGAVLCTGCYEDLEYEPQLTYRVEVRLTGEHAWTRNGQVFNTAAEAEAEGLRIARAWSAVAETRIRAAGYREE